MTAAATTMSTTSYAFVLPTWMVLAVLAVMTLVGLGVGVAVFVITRKTQKEQGRK